MNYKKSIAGIAIFTLLTGTTAFAELGYYTFHLVKGADSSASLPAIKADKKPMIFFLKMKL